MQGFKVVADNTTLVYLTKLDIWFPVLDLLRIPFSQIHIPQEVKREYRIGADKDPHRHELLQRIEGNDRFWRDCHEFDPYIRALLDSEDGIEPGESEVFAQFMSIGARYIISDDRRFTIAINKRYPYITILTTLHVLCMLEQTGCIAEWPDCMRNYARIRKTTAKDLRKVYVESAKLTGVKKGKKEISEKCSLKILGVS